MTKIENRIAELEAIQNNEIQNNFANGDLYNDCENKLNMIRLHGQEEAPEYDETFDFNILNAQCK